LKVGPAQLKVDTARHSSFHRTKYRQIFHNVMRPISREFTGLQSANSLRTRALTGGWPPAGPHGFTKLWQFRPAAGESDKPPDNAGPQWRQPSLARLEAVLFLAREPLNSRKIAQLANLAGGTEARTLIRRLNQLYDVGGQAFRVKEVAGGYQLLTRPAFGTWLKRMLQAPVESRLSAPALETLAVVAYRQPILRSAVETIRGVQCDEMLRQLLERDLVRILGRSEDLGRPRLYGTTKRFLELFGLRNLDELPRAAEFKSSTSSAESNLADNSSREVNINRNPGAGREQNITSTEPNSEENSVTTRIRPAPVREELVEDSLAALAEAARRKPAVSAPVGAKDEDEDEEDEDEDDDWDDDDDEDDDEEEESEEADDDFVDDEWEEVDDDEEDEEDDEEDDDDDWEDDDEEDWDDDDDEDEEEDEEEWKEDEK
jgi:segregation and condensation protein B